MTTPNTALEPIPINGIGTSQRPVAPLSFRCGFLFGGSHGRRGSAFGSLGVIHNMKRIRWPFLFCCLLVILTASGCTTYRREAFLKSHSLNRFTADRPQVGKLLRQHPALEQWLSTEWNRPVEGYRIFWSDEQPTASSVAEHVPELHHHLIVIRVSKRLTPVDQLVALAYETCNAQGLPEFDALYAQTATGKISRDQFVNEKIAIEYAAFLRLKDNFPELLPLTSGEVAKTKVYRALLQIPVGGFQEYRAWSLRRESPNYLHAEALYGHEYDQLVKNGQFSTPNAVLEPTPTAP